MKGDFSRMTFDRTKHFSRVLMQQGRVQLDADWNEQAAIMLYYLRTLAADLIGPHGGPGNSFEIAVCEKDGKPSACNAADPDIIHLNGDFYIMPGHYYVDGILCESDGEPVRYTEQSAYPTPEAFSLSEGERGLVYLDVWERHITHIEDQDRYGDEPSIREVALDGPDTATRSKIIWQVKVYPLDDKVDEEASIDTCPIVGDIDGSWPYLMRQWQPFGWLRARARMAQDQDTMDPCITPPDARYRGVENQLYRVEIHQGGLAWDGSENTREHAATFKWSRDNGIVVFPIEKLRTSDQETVAILETLGRDDASTLYEGDWVEVVDDDYVMMEQAAPLLNVEKVNRDTREVTLSGETPDVGFDQDKHPLLRRWDHKAGDPDRGGLELIEAGTALIKESDEDDEGWLMLEDGVMIQFQPPESGNNINVYRTGDYWLIPARTATGDVEWPGTVDQPAALPPHGIEHHYAPLAVIQVEQGGLVSLLNDCRRPFGTLTTLSQ